MTPDHVIAVGNVLGEGIQWHKGSGLWWTDIQRSILLHQLPGSALVEEIAMPERVGSFALIEGDADHILCAFETGFGVYDLKSRSVAWLDRPESGGEGRRFNDGRVDRHGQFWAGTMVEDSERAAPGSAALYCLDCKGTLSVAHSGVGISNGLAWSPDGRTMYFADSPARTIFAFEIDGDGSVIGGPRHFATTPEGAYPDGATVDADGCLWSTQWGASRVVRYRPDGAIDRVLELPVTQPTCVAFGGDRLDELYITSARDELDAATLASQPHAGHVLVYRPGIVGLPEARYGGIFVGGEMNQ